MLLLIIKKIFLILGLDFQKALMKVRMFSLSKAIKAQGLSELVARLREIKPDISGQEPTMTPKDDPEYPYAELNRRALQAFQCKMMLDSIDHIKPETDRLAVVDIGDSAGTHMTYLSELLKGKYDLNTISVNLLEEAIKKIQNNGQKAILCRAEDLDLGDQKIDLFTSFEMVEHLHNPTIFFKRLAERGKSQYILVTVPFMKTSRVGLHYVRNEFVADKVTAGADHIFELSPQDWLLIMKHAGWEEVFQDVYYQYPRKLPILSFLLRKLWMKSDYEGFWGILLSKNDAYMRCYTDWED